MKSSKKTSPTSISELLRPEQNVARRRLLNPNPVQSASPQGFLLIGLEKEKPVAHAMIVETVGPKTTNDFPDSNHTPS